MIIVFTCSPFGVIKFDTETQEILNSHHLQPERIYGLTVLPNGNYVIGLTNETRLLNSELNLLSTYVDPLMNDLHSVELSEANRVLMTCAHSDWALEMDGLGTIQTQIKLTDYFKPPSWWQEDRKWQQNTDKTEKTWLHLNYLKKENGLYYGTAFHQVNDAYRIINTGFVFALDIQRKRVVFTFGQKILKWPHCVLLLPNEMYLVTDTGNHRLVEFRRLEDGSFDLIKYYFVEARVHHIEQVSTNEFLLTDCDRENPRILLFNRATGLTNVLWEPDDEIKAFAAEEEGRILQPYIVRRID